MFVNKLYKGTAPITISTSLRILQHNGRTDQQGLSATKTIKISQMISPRELFVSLSTNSHACCFYGAFMLLVLLLLHLLHLLHFPPDRPLVQPVLHLLALLVNLQFQAVRSDLRLPLVLHPPALLALPEFHLVHLGLVVLLEEHMPKSKSCE